MKYDIIKELGDVSIASLESFFEMKYDIIAPALLSSALKLESFFEMKYDIMSNLYFHIHSGNTDISLKKNDSKRHIF